jgi:DNA-directed RNA polymerase specialized sigma24 family protein
MGASKYDKEAAGRRIDEEHVFYTPKGVSQLIQGAQALNSRAYMFADFAALELVVDLRAAILQANLTPAQRRVIYLYLYCDLHYTDVAAEMGISQQAVSKHKNTACERIAAVFREWNYEGVGE